MLKYNLIAGGLLVGIIFSCQPTQSQESPQSKISVSPTISVSTTTEPMGLFELNKTFSLKLGETRQLKNTNLKVIWKKLINDSRCPKDVACVWAGEVNILIAVSDQKNEAEVKLKLPPVDISGVPVLNSLYMIELLNVKPYPGTAKTEEERKKTIDLRLTKKTQ